jgi:hypothetical protein
MHLKRADHRFYLTGGTALSRGYYRHRYSEDLDFFANDARDFELWRDRCVHALQSASAAEGWRLEVILREVRFGRAVVHGDVPLKLEFVNDVPFRVGVPWPHPALGSLDTKENILANKITALVDRQAPKDVADIYWLCCRDNLSLVGAMEGADGKAAGIFPPVVAQALERARRIGIPEVFWIEKPAADDFAEGIQRLVREIME